MIERRKINRTADNDWLKSLLDNMSSAVVIYVTEKGGEDFRIIDMNPAAEKIEGVTKAKTIGKLVTKCFPGVRKFGLLDIFKRVNKTGRPEYQPASYYQDKIREGWRENHVFKLPSGELIVIYNDVSSKVKDQMRIWDSEAQYRATLDAIGDFIMVIDKEKRIILANKPLKEYLNGKGISEPEKKTIEKIFHAAANKLSSSVSKAITTKTTLNVEQAWKYKNEDRIFNITITPIVEGKNSDRIVIILRDITESKAATKALKISKEFNDTLLGFVPSAVFTVGEDRKILTWDSKAEAITGYKAEEVIGKDCSLIRAGGCDKNCSLQRILAKDFQDMKEGEIIDKKGDRHFIRKKIGSLESVSWSGKGLIECFEDISDRKIDEEKLRESAKEWSETFDAMTDGISIHDIDCTIINVNKKMCELLARPKEQIIGKRCFRIFHNTFAPPDYCPVEEARRTGQKQSKEIFEPRFGKWINIEASPIRGENGKLLRFVHLVKDISERKQAEQLLKDRNAELERFNSFAIGRELKMIELKKQLRDRGKDK